MPDAAERMQKGRFPAPEISLFVKIAQTCSLPDKCSTKKLSFFRGVRHSIQALRPGQKTQGFRQAAAAHDTEV